MSAPGSLPSLPAQPIAGTALPHIQPLHLAGGIEEPGRAVSVPTVKARLARVRHLSDWLVRCQQVPANPAVSCAARHIACGAARRRCSIPRGAPGR